MCVRSIQKLDLKKPVRIEKKMSDKDAPFGASPNPCAHTAECIASSASSPGLPPESPEQRALPGAKGEPRLVTTTLRDAP